MLPTTFRFIWSSCLRVEDFQKSTNQKQELPVVAMFVNGSGQNEQSLQRTFHRFYLPSVGSFGKAVLENKMFRTRPIRNQNCLWQPYLLMDRDEMNNLYRGLPIESSYQDSVHLANGFGGEDILEISNQSTVAAMFVNRSGRNMQSLQRTFLRCFLASFGSFGHEVSEKKICLNRPIRNNNCLWRPCLLANRN